MQNMSIGEALAVLGLNSQATEPDIRQAYRDKSKLHHPDKSGVENTLQVELNTAYEVAKKHAKKRTSVILRESANQITKIDEAICSQKAAFEAKERVSYVRKKKISRINRFRFLTLIIFGVNIVLLFFHKELLPALGVDFTNSVTSASKFGFIRLLFVQLSVIFGALTVFFQIMKNRIENKLSSYMHKLTDRKSCGAEFANAMKFQDKAEITEDDLVTKERRNQGKSPLSYFTSIETDELRKILVLKAIEHRLIVPQTDENITPESIDKYSLKFKPSLFRPKETKPEEKRHEPTKKEAINEIFIGLILTLVSGGLTFFLAYFKSSWWSILPGIFSLGGIGGIFSGITSFRNAKY